MNSPKKRKTSGKDIFAVMLLVIIIAGFVMLIMRSTDTTDTLTVDDFIEYVNEGDVTKITATPVGSGANADLYNIDGTYKDDNGDIKSFSVIINENIFDTYVINGTYDGNIEIEQLVSVDWLSIITMVILPIGLIVFLIYLFKNSNQGNNKAFDFAKSKARKSTKSKTRFTDVAGADEEKEEMEEVIDFLKNPQKYYALGARIPKGILLIGPPGTGKTLLARAVAGEAGVPFFSISGSDFVEMFVGVGASRVRDMFKQAKANAPCIVFIDEIDAVGRQRGSGIGGGHDEREQTLNQLLVEMDGFGDNSGIIVMAATNRPDVLDPALLRPGRFDRTITMSNPDLLSRVAILKVHARNKKVSGKVNFTDVARRTPGFSGADIENLLNEAALLAAREDRKEIKIYDIDEAIDRVMMGPAKRSRKYSPDEKKMVSYHESGHAVIGLKLDNAEKVQKVTIVPRGMAGGYTMMTPDKERFLSTYSQLIDTITGLLGGRTAEELFIGDISTGAENDIQRATKIARSMVAEYGMSKLGPIQYEKKAGSVFLGRDYMSDKDFSDQVALEIDNEVRNIINECHEKAKVVLNENADLVKLMASHLIEIETLTKEDIYELSTTGKLEWWEKKKAKIEAENVAKEKEQELQDIYRQQLAAMQNKSAQEDRATKIDASPEVVEATEVTEEDEASKDQKSDKDKKDSTSSNTDK
ncbi:MAG: ATP-dependent zinc metalloprotease FtsH [Bacilli bacterium]